MSGPVVVSWVRPRKPQQEQPEQLAKLPKPLKRWPFPSSDPAERDRMAREHLREQREEILRGPEALL